MMSTVEPTRLTSTVLKVGHHGSYTSSSPEFLNVVRPQLAIYSARSGNAYGHPHVQTLNNLLTVGAVIYGTDADGTVIVETDGESYRYVRRSLPRWNLQYPIRQTSYYPMTRLAQTATAALCHA